MARVSSGDENGEERSVTEQRAECEAACRDEGWRILTYYEEVESASRYGDERRGGREREAWLGLLRD